MLYAYLAVALLAAALSGIGVWNVQEWRRDSLDKERIEAAAELKRIDAKRIDTAAVGHEKDRAEARTRTITITKEVERVIEKPFYVASELCIDAAGLQQLNAARAPATAASKPSADLPRPSLRRWWQPSGEPAKPD